MLIIALSQCALISAKLNSPVVDAPVEAEVQGAEFATFPHHFHHGLVVELGDVPQIQDAQVMKLQDDINASNNGDLIITKPHNM